MKEEVQMSVSSICIKNGKKQAYVSFTDGRRTAEGTIPSCKIETNRGFNKEEIDQLEKFMKNELPQIKKMAARVNVMDAFMGKKEESCKMNNTKESNNLKKTIRRG